MADIADWATAFARQADADFRGWELAQKSPESIAAECHKLLLLQMACEKLCKAHLLRTGTPLDSIRTSHAYIANPLPIVLKQQILHMGQDPGRMKGIFEKLRRLAAEVEILNPAVERDGRRPDNCEYPWEYGGRVISPLDWGFAASRLCTEPAGRLFLKLIRGAIDRLL
jgi:hypothetical protein